MLEIFCGSMWPDRPLEVKVAGELNIVYIYRTLNNVPLPHCNDLSAHRTYYGDLAGFLFTYFILDHLVLMDKASYICPIYGPEWRGLWIQDQ